MYLMVADNPDNHFTMHIYMHCIYIYAMCIHTHTHTHIKSLICTSKANTIYMVNYVSINKCKKSCCESTLIFKV